MSAIARVDLFCRVVDNLGDAGVCWRLARRLAHGHGQTVRLFIDLPETLDAFVRAGSADHALRESGQLRVLSWDAAAIAEAVATPADLVIETFGCDLPEAYAEQLAQRPSSRWYNLEYLSAEDWVEGCHALPSPHPRLGVRRTFFFPGFTASTGGLLREPGLMAARQDWQRMARAEPAADSARALVVGLFCYAEAPIAALLTALTAGGQTVHCKVFQGPARAAVEDWMRLHPGAGLQVEWLPWLSQDGFDQALWSCDFNVVRGEDSFVRAQWAGRPLLWDIYPQADDAHLVKMAAFLRRYREGLSAPAAEALGALWQPWVRREPAALMAGWQAVRAALPLLQQHAEAWCQALAQRPDLADALMQHAQASLAPHGAQAARC